MVFSFCRTHCVSRFFLVSWTEQRGTTTGTPQQWKECRYEKTSTDFFFFLQSRQYAWLQKVVKYRSYATFQPNSGSLFSQIFRIAWPKTNSIGTLGERNFWGSSSCQSDSSYPVRSKFLDSDSPFLPPHLCGFPDLSARGVPLSLSKQAPYTERTPCVGGNKERGGSLQQKLHLNMTHPNSPPLFSVLLIALHSVLCAALKAPNISPSSHGKSHGRSGINSDKPLQAVFGWTFCSVAHLGPHKYWNSLNVWELWVFLLWLSRGLNSWNKNKHNGDSYSNHLNWIIFSTREAGAKFWFCKGHKRLTTALGKPDRLWEMTSGDSCQAFHFPFNF